jgi:hypothetical protein
VNKDVVGEKGELHLHPAAVLPVSQFAVEGQETFDAARMEVVDHPLLVAR